MLKLASKIRSLLLKPAVIKVLLTLKLGVFLLWLNRIFKVSTHSLRVAIKLRDHFIPHEGNNYHPRILKHKALLVYSIILVVIKVAAILLPVILPSSSLLSSALTPQNILSLTNQARHNLGLNSLTVNELLARAAQSKAADMMAGQYFAHVSPTGVSPIDWIVETGYKYAVAGENLAVHYRESEDVQAGWMASPTHKANILNTSYTEIGVATLEGEFEGVSSTIVVQMFGRPSAVTAPVRVATKPVVVTTLPATLNTNQARVSGLATKEPFSDLKQTTNNILPKNNSNPLVAPTSNLALAPVVYDDSLQVKQNADTYDIKITIVGAVNVSAQLGNKAVALTQNIPGSTWRGSLPIAPSHFNSGGEMLSVIATGREGALVNRPLRLLAPTSSAPRVFAFTNPLSKTATFFRFITLENLDDSVHRFYLYIMVFLAAALLINIFVKIRIQHPTVIAHATAVIGLALFLGVV